MQTRAEKVPPADPSSVSDLIQQDSLLTFIRSKNDQTRTANNILTQLLTNPLSENCFVSCINLQTLIINTNNAVWANQLRYLQDQILSALKKDNKTAYITQIKIRVTPPEQQAKVIKKAKKITMSQSTGHLIRDSAQSIKNPELKQALLNLAKNAKS